MKVKRKTVKYKLTTLGILLFLLVFPIFLSTHLFRFPNALDTYEHDENDFLNDNPKLNAPPNVNFFAYYKLITIDHNKVAGSVSYPNFPVLISIKDPDLRFDVQSDGDDIAFSIDNAWVDHEIESFDQTFNTTHAQLIAWVRVPTLSGVTDTIIRMYYGNSTMNSRQNPAGVWDSDYRGVWHLNEDTGGSNSIFDSTSYSNDGTDINSPNLGENGQIHNSVGFTDASGQRIEVSDDTSLDISNQLTVEAWINPTVMSKWTSIVSKMDGAWGSGSSAEEDLYVAIDSSDNLFIGLANQITYDDWGSAVSITAGIWQHFVFTYDSSSSIGRIFINGGQQETHDFGLGTLDTNANPFYIGFNRGWTGEVFDGSIDEVRMSSRPRSAGWINTEYENQYDPDSFYSIGSEQTVTLEPSKVIDFMYYKIITIDQTQVSGTGSHTNFPVLISIIDEDLKYHAQPDGDDIAFSVGGEWLNHEIEEFDQAYSGTQAHLRVWVQIPSLSTSINTTLIMYYGNSTMMSQQNPGGVWGANYVGVWHLDENPTSTVYDSTPYSNDGTTLGSMGSSDLVPCKIGDGFDLDGFNDMIQISESASLDSVSDEGTLSLWINWADSSDGGYQRVMTTTDRFTLNPIPPPTYLQTGGFEWAVQPDGDHFFYPHGGISGNYNIVQPDPFTNSIWHYLTVTLVHSTRSVKIYLDGTSLSFTQENVPSQWSVLANLEDWLWGGNLVASNSQFRGRFDEIRAANVARSAGWILTEYNNQYDPISFYSIGNEQHVSDQPDNYDYFNYYKMFTIDHTKINGSGSHVNFPLLISIIDDDLRYDVQDDGDDIAFSIEGKWLDHQIELFNQSYSGTHAQLVVWVRIPFLSTSFDTNLTMYYGNSTMTSRQNPIDVWNSDYAGVWHLNEDPSGIPPQIDDSTIPASDGISYGTMTSSDQVSGMIGEALDFDGSNDYIEIGNPSEMQITGAITVQTWFKADFVGNDYLVAKHGGVGFRGWDVSFDPGTSPDGWLMFRYSPDGSTIITTGYEAVSANQWYHVVAVFKPNDYSKLFLDGIEVAIDTTGIPPSMNDPALPLRIARRSDIGGTSYVKGIIDEVRISTLARSNDWIITEYNNQYDPSSFYSVGSEVSLNPVLYLEAQLNAIDLYGINIPNATITMYQNTLLMQRGITDIDGSILFTNIIEGQYNFTVSISSPNANVTELVNFTSQGILINQPFQSIDLICDVTTHFFEVIDLDNSPIDSGWILVGNDTHILQKCVIDPTGHTNFWWVDAPPSQYNYTVYYSDIIYNPSTLNLNSGDIVTKNATIQVQLDLTTVEFTILTINAPISPVSGAKLKLTVGNPMGDSIVNLTPDLNGQATLRWMDSAGLSGDYSIQIEFFGVNRLFNDTLGGPADAGDYSFTLINKVSLEFRILIDLSKFQTELISLNPVDYIDIEWGSLLKLRSIFNVSNVDVGYENLLGPVYADSMTYEIVSGGSTIKSGSFLEEVGNEGRHYIDIDTREIEQDESYIIIITAHKSGYTIPSDIILQLNVLEIEVQLNQSDNDDSGSTVYWSDSVDMTLSSYGVNSETLTIENALFQSVDHGFNFMISDVEHHWNLTTIEFNIYGISWNANLSNINVTIEDPYGGFYYMFNISTHGGWDYIQGTWTGITIDLNRASRNNDNNFEFQVGGTFDGTVDIVANAYFLRDSLSVQYSKFNISSEISLLTEVEGWAIGNATFEISNCYYTSNWSKVDLSSLMNLNITTNEGFKYSLDSGNPDGTGSLTINDRIIYPIVNQFLFAIETEPNIIFDAIVRIDYIQEFYKTQILETFNRTQSEQGISNGGTFQVNAVETSWVEHDSKLWITGIKSGSTYLFPSEIAMNITIGSQTYSISDSSRGIGSFSLAGFSKNQILQAIIESSSPVNFSILLSVEYLRTVLYEIIGSLSYTIIEAPSISGTVQYNTGLGYYLKTVDSSPLDADDYTIRFSISKEHFHFTSKDLKLFVLNRPTLLNGSTEFYRAIETIYINDAVNFSFLYTDEFTGAKVINLETQYFIWESYDSTGTVNETGQGDVDSDLDNSYIVNFNTETRSTGSYLIILILDKENYEYKNGMVLLTIIKRDIEYIFGEELQDKQANVVQGSPVPIELTLTDPTRGGVPLINATIKLMISGKVHFVNHTGNGTYIFNLPTNDVDAFFSSKTFIGIITISKASYNPVEVKIIIVVEMEQIFPGVPTFYFLLIISAAIALVGSIVGYRVIHNARIPSFVKKVRAMKKSIRGDKSISESLIYRDKEIFIGEILKNDWSKIGLSLEEIFDIKLEKEKKITPSKQRISKAIEHDNKPLGLVLMKWDERIGTEIKIRYPSEVQISDKTLMQIYSTHEYSGEKGIITLTAEATNILSYYTGPEQGYYLLLLLNLDDDPDLYEGGIADILRSLLESIDDDTYMQIVPPLFQRLSLYPSLTYEQILALIYQNKIKRSIIDLLRDEGVEIKSELIIWLKDKQVHGFFDLDTIFSEMIKLDILKVSSIKDIPSELIFLTKDIFMARVPPLKLLDKPTSHGLPSQFAKEYPNDVISFFQTYLPSEKDNIMMAEILVNPQVYETLRLLRDAIVTRDDLAKLRNKGVTDIYGVLKTLWDSKMIKVYHDDQNNEYYALISDFYVDFIFPKYLLKSIKNSYEQKSKVKKALIEYLNILEDTYYKQKSEEK
ncbi:MAG: DUF2341 domain-containing protein [Promethearchaeota archaeon]|jgi:hypothetical protein